MSDRIKINPCKEFQSTYGDEDYNVQDMLLRQANFPSSHFHGADEMLTFWSDRSHEEWARGNKAQGNSKSEKKFLAFCKGVSGLEDITGGRLVRFTHCQSGYPVYRLDVYIKKTKQDVHLSDSGPVLHHHPMFDRREWLSMPATVLEARAKEKGIDLRRAVFTCLGYDYDGGRPW